MYNDKGYEIGKSFRFHLASPLSGYVEGEICSLEFGKAVDSEEVELVSIGLTSRYDNKIYVGGDDVSWAEKVEEEPLD